MTPPVRPKLLATACGVIAALLAAVPASAGNGGFGPVPPESPNAEGISTAYWFITAIAIAIFLLVQVLLVTFLIRFRRRSRDRNADGAQIHGSSRLETMWTVGPVLILFAIAAFVFVKLPRIKDIPSARAGSSNLVVKVTGRQFYWQFEYPNGVITIDELRAPLDRVVRLEVTAPDFDVIHSWWIPALGGKIDAIPGRVNTTWFQGKRLGVFRGQCAELCGLNHARMWASVEVMPEAQFAAWLSGRRGEQTSGSSPLGRELYLGACAKCHGLAGQGMVAVNAPQLQGSSLTGDRKGIERLLRQGQNLMPAVGRDWSAEQMKAMTDYLEERFARGK